MNTDKPPINYTTCYGQLSIYEGRSIGNFDKCWYCGVDCKTTADHFWPKSLGGRLKVRACANCNREKKGLTPNGWAKYLKGQRDKFEKTGFKHLVIKYDRMITATESLWERVKWSI